MSSATFRGELDSSGVRGKGDVLALAQFEVVQVLSTPAHLDETISVMERSTIDKNENIAKGNRFSHQRSPGKDSFDVTLVGNDVDYD